MVVVIDTNVMISATILKQSTSGHAVRKAFLEAVVIRSLTTTEELLAILKRKKFDKYFRNEYERDIFIHLFITRSKLIEVTHDVTACRDPKDNKYLELALSGKADCIISGDKDLLVLHPFETIPILSPRDFIDTF